MSELVKTLRFQSVEISSVGIAGWGNTMADAADEIDRLRAELATADAFYKVALAERDYERALNTGLLAVSQAQQAAIERLREYVRDCADNWDCDEDAHTYHTVCRKCDAVALMADLGETK